MSKKDSNVEINFVPADSTAKEQSNGSSNELLFESEAYGNPQPDDGMGTTVTKPIGIGGPVPIVASKHNTIQLQPIIVPLAVVPYMTQDTNVLRTDGHGQQGQYRENDFAEAVEFDKVGKKKSASSMSAKSRIFALVIFILSALVVIPFILSNFYSSLGEKALIFDMNIIGTLTSWIGGTKPPNMVVTILQTIGAGFSALTVIVSAVAIVVGKMPRVFTCVLTLFSAASLLSVLIFEVVSKKLIADVQIVFIVTVALSLLAFLLSLVFAVLLNRESDKDDRVQTATLI
ncbi:MAG: hypothetical protein RSA24_01545 [Clostridia bacterium]